MATLVHTNAHQGPQKNLVGNRGVSQVGPLYDAALVCHALVALRRLGGQPTWATLVGQTERLGRQQTRGAFVGSTGGIGEEHTWLTLVGYTGSLGG